MNGFRSDIPKLAEKAAEFDDLAGQAQRIADELHRAIDSAGRCWGSDEIGSRFASGHQKPAEQALQQVNDMHGKLAEMGVNFAETADTYRRVDTSNAEDLDVLARDLGQG